MSKLNPGKTGDGGGRPRDLGEDRDAYHWGATTLCHSGKYYLCAKLIWQKVWEVVLGRHSSCLRMLSPCGLSEPSLVVFWKPWKTLFGQPFSRRGYILRCCLGSLFHHMLFYINISVCLYNPSVGFCFCFFIVSHPELLLGRLAHTFDRIKQISVWS